MPTENIMYPCSVCQKQTVHIQKRINHILHLLLSVLFIGLWLLVWIGIAIFGDRTPVCTICGNGDHNHQPQVSENNEPTIKDVRGFLKFIGMIATFLIVLLIFHLKIWEKIPFLKDIIN